jgi:hypothetical protein
MTENENEKPLAAAIAEQKRLVAEDLFAEAWDGGISAGIEPDMLAEMLARRALETLAGCTGEEAAAAVVARIDTLHQQGQLLVRRTLQ